MGDDADQDGEHEFEEILESVGRREVLVGVVVASGVLVSVTQSDDTDHLTQAEDQLTQLAKEINNADLVAPLQSKRLSKQISETLNTANDALAQPAQDDPEREQRRAAIEAAIDYYTRLAETLETANDLRRRIAGSERGVLYHEDIVASDPAADFDTAKLDESITRLSNAQETPDENAGRDQKLVPDQQRIVSSLETQRKVLNVHLTVQQVILDSTTAIRAGIRAHEQSRFDASRAALAQAQEALSDEIPESIHQYRLSVSGLSLDEYATLLARRREAVEKLRNVADASVPVKKRRATTDQAINLLFEARKLVVSRR